MQSSSQTHCAGTLFSYGRPLQNPASNLPTSRQLVPPGYGIIFGTLDFRIIGQTARGAKPTACEITIGVAGEKQSIVAETFKRQELAFMPTPYRRFMCVIPAGKTEISVTFTNPVLNSETSWVGRYHNWSYTQLQGVFTARRIVSVPADTACMWATWNM